MVLMNNGAKSRWFRFSLRALLLFTGGLCVLLAVQVNKANKQRRAVARLFELGASVSYDYDQTRPGAGPKSPAWLRNVIGIDFVSTCNAVHLMRPVPRDQDLEILNYYRLKPVGWRRT